MPSSEFVLSRVLEFIQKEGEAATVSQATVTFDDLTQKANSTFNDEVIKAFVTGPKKNLLGNTQTEEAELVVYVKGGDLTFNPQKDDKVTLGVSVYQVIDSEAYRIRGITVLLGVFIKR